MSSDFDYLPRRDQFFPSLRRGHGTTHPHARVRDGEVVRKAGVCASVGCKGDKHIDMKANIADWISDHGRDSDPLNRS
jgi:hypothetical protein